MNIKNLRKKKTALKEIKIIVNKINNGINANRSQKVSRKYNLFLAEIGMETRRNFEELSRYERQFKNFGISFWDKEKEIKQLQKFKKNATITFKKTLMKENSEENNMGKVKHAGKINISKSESGITPYQHQQDAFYNLQKEIIKSGKNPFAGLLVLPTGGGKTLTAALWIAKNFLDKNKKVLWIAHRHELLEQAKGTFTNTLAYSDVFREKDNFNYRIISGIHDKPINIKKTDDIIFASKDSLNAGFEHLLQNWIKNNTDEIFLVIDEAHHSTAKTYRKLIDNIQKNVKTFRLLGLTATPTRTAENEKGLLKKVFADDIIFKIDLKTLIRFGILSNPVFEEEPTGQNFIRDLTDQQIELLKTFDINSIGDKIAENIAKNKERNFKIVDTYVSNKKKYKQTLVFALNVDNAIALNKLFQEHSIKSDYVISSVRDSVTGITSNFTKENKEKIEDFREGKLEVLINVNILTEGTDVPNVQSIFLARPTISTILMTQMIGRGLRGPKAGGTKEAYIVSFLDDWEDKIAWINPEKLFIEENVDFNDTDKETKKQLIRLVSISKIEEFAILANSIIDPETKMQLEKLDFIQRIPKGIYQFRYLVKSEGEEVEKNCEILVYDNIENSYKNLVETLPYFVKDNNLEEREILDEQELVLYSKQIEDEFFSGVDRYPAYSIEDIKSLLQYYIVQDEIPQYIELKDRENFDIDRIAHEIYDKDLGPRSEKELIDSYWIGSEVEWQTFFNYDKRIFLNEINIAKSRLLHPDLYSKERTSPTETQELRSFENMSLYDIRTADPAYEKALRDQVFEKYTDKNGYYYSAASGFKTKSRLSFQVDHIKPMHNGGLTVLENLQLLTRAENMVKGAK